MYKVPTGLFNINHVRPKNVLRQATEYSTQTNKIQRNFNNFNPLNAELNPIRHLLALVGAHHMVQVTSVRVKNHMNKCLTKHYIYLI